MFANIYIEFESPRLLRLTAGRCASVIVLLWLASTCCLVNAQGADTDATDQAEAERTRTLDEILPNCALRFSEVTSHGTDRLLERWEKAIMPDICAHLRRRSNSDEVPGITAEYVTVMTSLEEAGLIDVSPLCAVVGPESPHAGVVPLPDLLRERRAMASRAGAIADLLHPGMLRALRKTQDVLRVSGGKAVELRMDNGAAYTALFGSGANRGRAVDLSVIYFIDDVQFESYKRALVFLFAIRAVDVTPEMDAKQRVTLRSALQAELLGYGTYLPPATRKIMEPLCLPALLSADKPTTGGLPVPTSTSD